MNALELVAGMGPAFWLVSLILVLLVGATLASGRRLRSIRLLRLKSKDTTPAVPTESPVANPEEAAEARAVRSIRNQYTILKRVALPGMILVGGLVAALPFLSRAPAAILSVTVGIVTVMVGIALRPILENVFAGLTLSYSRNLSIGDTVQIGDIYGTIEDISPTHTVVKIWDWRRHVISNANMLSTNFINLSLFDEYVWVRAEFSVDVSADLLRLEEAVFERIVKSERMADFEPPRFWVTHMGETSTRCMIAAWADTPPEGWLLKEEILRTVQEVMREQGIAPARWRVGAAGEAGAFLAPSPSSATRSYANGGGVGEEPKG